MACEGQCVSIWQKLGSLIYWSWMQKKVMKFSPFLLSRKPNPSLLSLSMEWSGSPKNKLKNEIPERKDVSPPSYLLKLSEGYAWFCFSKLSHGLAFKKRISGNYCKLVGSGKRSEDLKRGPILSECRGCFTLQIDRFTMGGVKISIIAVCDGVFS